MFGVAVVAVLLGYSLLYTGAENLTHGGEGHTLFQNLGITTTVNLGEPVAPNLSGQPPQTSIPDWLGTTPI